MASKRNGKQYQACVLVKDLCSGPNGIGKEKSKQGDDYRLWLSTWVLPKMRELVPQLSELEFTHCSSAMIEFEIPGYTTRRGQ